LRHDSNERGQKKFLKNGWKLEGEKKRSFDNSPGGAGGGDLGGEES